MDACRLDAQCIQPNRNHCALAGSPTWTCTGHSCTAGRPLLVSGAPRTAPATRRGDWIERGIAPHAGSLDAGTREIVAGHWLAAAALEHSSVASFARFALELLALGAPAELVAGAQRAGLDEVEHARLSYGVASTYAGRLLGPGPLDLTAVALRADARDVLRSLVIEGCVGETLGVAEALALRDRASDPALASLHARIASDEQRHAELSWQALAWLLRGAGGDMAELAAVCFEEGTATLSSDPPVRPATAPEHGVLEAAELGALRRRALREVVAPCAAALLGAVRLRGDLPVLPEVASGRRVVADFGAAEGLLPGPQAAGGQLGVMPFGAVVIARVTAGRRPWRSSLRPRARRSRGCGRPASRRCGGGSSSRAPWRSPSLRRTARPFRRRS
jgi:hypothetical protein